MSGLNRLRKRTWNWSVGKGFMTGGERREKGRVAARNAMYAGAQMPDEEEIRRTERRKAARRRGSRADTVLTDLMDTLG